MRPCRQDDQHESFMRQEQQPHRGEKLDMRVHACLYFIRPTGHTYFALFAPLLCSADYPSSCSLKPLDIECMKRLGSRVNLIPIIAKADTLTPNDLAAFKHKVHRHLLSCRSVADLPCSFAKSSSRKGFEFTSRLSTPTTKRLPNTLDS